MKTISEVILKFRQEYKQAYKGILSDEILEQGNSWFENFILTAITEIVDSAPSKVIPFKSGDSLYQGYSIHAAKVEKWKEEILK